MILHIFNVLLELMMSFSEAFPHKQTQQTQFRYWKGQILHKLSVFFSHFIFEKEIPLAKEELAHFGKDICFNKSSLNLTMQLLFFFRNETPTHATCDYRPHFLRLKEKEHILISTSKNDISHICQILNSISRLPLIIEQDPDLKCYIDPKNWKGKPVTSEILTEIVGKEVANFSGFFQQRQSLLSDVTEQERKEISCALDRILYVYKVQSSMKKLPDSERQQEHLRKILSLAQSLIDKEEGVKATSDEA
mmetsp:Transcript_20548/g.31291  ORF Transcript_20548/g.31291 Transcript_20548/m.31291 type:complete len:249 (-) Transcript_20548:1619-2365(-)